MFYMYIILTLALALLSYKLIKISTYWKRQNITYEPSWPLIGNMASVVFGKKHIMEVTIDLYKKYYNYRYVGMMQFTLPLLMIRDIKLIKELTSTNFEHFHDHFAFAKTENDPVLSKGIVNLNGQDWRQMRATLSPAFSSAKMRNMHQFMVECAENFVNHFNTKEKVVVDLKAAISRFATDVIANAFFGIKVNSFREPQNTFFKMSQKLNFGVGLLIKIILFAKFPFLVEYLRIRFFSNEAVDFFRFIIKDNIDKRGKRGIQRPDLIQLFMEIRKGVLSYDVDKIMDEGFATTRESQFQQSTKPIQLTDDDIVAQAMIFFFAGSDSTTTSYSFLVYELALNPHVQKKLQEEIDSVRRQHKDKLPYEALLSMKYLDQVVSEGLRLWPSGFQTDRLCTKDYLIEPTTPNEKAFLVKKGTSILIPLAAIQRDPNYFPDPNKFDPERFSDENKSKIIPGSYMPFGVGPRICLGSRFALLEMKTFFFSLLSEFNLVPVAQTPIPLKLKAWKITLEPQSGFKIGFRRRKLH